MKKNILKILAIIIITLNLGAAMTIPSASAEEPTYKAATIPKPNTIPGPTNQDQRKALTQKILPRLAVLMIGTTASFSLLFLIIAGVKFVTAYGNDEAVQTAKKQIIWGIIGLVVALMSYTIVTIVSNFNYKEGAPGTPAATGTPTPPST